MVRRGIFGFLFLLPLAASAGLDTKISYYGEEFPRQMEAGGESLRQALRGILSGAHTAVAGGFDQIGGSCGKGDACYRHTAIGYTRARQFLFGEFYLVPEGRSYGVKDVYCQRVAHSSEFRGEKPGPGQIPDHRTINAEHTWPQSHFSGAYPKEDQKSDLHHLFPTDSEMNSKRSNLEFGDVSDSDEPLKCSESRLGSPRSGGQTVFEPPTQHKGNVARALFYFSVRYDMKISREEEEALRAWNRLDPVDEEEERRNERIFDLQKNRNPFVDYPDLAEKISDF